MPTKPKQNYKPGGKDLFQTPPHALEPLGPFIKFNTIWEPCAGQGILVRELNKYGNVVSGDLQTGQDFFEHTPDIWDCIITNPPFSLKFKFIERAIELGKPWAFLVPTDTLAAAAFHKVALVCYNRPYKIEVLNPVRRVNYKTPEFGWPKPVWNEKKQKTEMKGGAQMPTCWITWGFNIENNLPKYADMYICNMRNPRYDDGTNTEI